MRKGVISHDPAPEPTDEEIVTWVQGVPEVTPVEAAEADMRAITERHAAALADAFSKLSKVLDAQA